MRDMQNVKYANMIPPAAIVENTNAASVEVDTLGYEYVSVAVSLGATDIAMVALYVEETDTTGAGYTAFAGADFTGQLPTSTSDNGIFLFDLNLLGHKRFIKLVATAGNGTAGTYVSALGILSRGGENKYDATSRGVLEVISL